MSELKDRAVSKIDRLPAPESGHMEADGYLIHHDARGRMRSLLDQLDLIMLIRIWKEEK